MIVTILTINSIAFFSKYVSIFALKSYFCQIIIKKMKRILPLFILLASLVSCEEDVKFNSPGFQGQKDDAFWRANDARAYLSSSGSITIEGLNQFEEVILGTSSTNVGKYSLGTSNQDNFASYSLTLDGFTQEYATIPVPGQVSGTTLISGGTGYSTSGNVETTGGTGSGLYVATTANDAGVVTKITIVAPGNGYMAGDLITVTGGNLNCRFRVLNVRNSNGEIEITEYDATKMTISGKFKFNASDVTNPISGQVVNFQYGEFYKVPIFPQQ